MDIELKRAYDSPHSQDGYRVLVDGIWPRGVSKADAELDGHPKDVAPSTDLRKWFDHDPDKWGEFRNRYLQELADNTDAVEHCLAWCRAGPVTLLFAAKDRDHNQAVVLRDYLKQRLKGSKS